MARRELRRKITATVLTVTALCCLLGVCAWLLLGSNVFSDTIRIMMLVCTVVLGVATIGLLVAKVQEIRALREMGIRDRKQAPGARRRGKQNQNTQMRACSAHKMCIRDRSCCAPRTGNTGWPWMIFTDE